jgi:hypothetical protein
MGARRWSSGQPWAAAAVTSAAPIAAVVTAPTQRGGIRPLWMVGRDRQPNPIIATAAARTAKNSAPQCVRKAQPRALYVDDGE